MWSTVGPTPHVVMDSGAAYIFGTGPTPCAQVNLSNGAITYLVGLAVAAAPAVTAAAWRAVVVAAAPAATTTARLAVSTVGIGR